jgi:hypothetical protein
MDQDCDEQATADPRMPRSVGDHRQDAAVLLMNRQPSRRGEAVATDGLAGLGG